MNTSTLGTNDLFRLESVRSRITVSSSIFIYHFVITHHHLPTTSDAYIYRKQHLPQVKQSFFFTLFWTEALESILNRDSDATGQLLMDYGCNNFVSVEDALQCLQQVTEADLYAVDLVLPLLALHESVASEAADAMSRLAAVPENQKTILDKPAIDLLLRASKYHFVSAPLQAHCWRCIRSLCASMPELAIPQVMRGARRSRVDEKEKPADNGGDPVLQTDDSLYLLFHLLSHHSDEPAFLKEGLQTFSALVKHMGQDDWKGREALMKDVLDFGMDAFFDAMNVCTSRSCDAIHLLCLV